MDTAPQKKSYKLLWIAGASIVVLVIVVGVVLAVVPRSDKRAAETPSAQTATATTVDTKSDIQAKMKKVDENIKQAKSDQAAAVAALNDDKKQIKVGN